MRIVCLAWCLFAAPFGSAARSEDVAPAATQSQAVRAPSAELVLRHVPTDAFATFYIRDIDGVLSGSLARLVEAMDNEVVPVFEWLRGTTDGPALLTLAGMPLNPFSWRITLIAGTTADRATFVDGLERTVMPLWNRRLRNEIGTMQVSRSPSGDRVMFVGPLTKSLELGFREGYLIATSVPGAAAKWDPASGAPEEFASRPEWKDLTSGFAGLPDVAALVDLRAIMPALAALLDAQVPNLGQSLQVGLPTSAGLAVGALAVRSAAAVPAPTETSQQTDPTVSGNTTAAIDSSQNASYAARLSVFVDRSRPGPWRFLAGATTPVSIAEAYPADTTFLVRGGMTSLADQWENFAAVLGGIDEEIAKEAREDAEAFKAEIGFDLFDDFLSNFAEEWAIGGRVDGDGPHDVLMVFRLEDGAEFQRRFEVLRQHYDLRSSRTDHRGTTIETAKRLYGPFSFAIHDELLLVSSDAGNVAQGIDALLDEQSLAKHDIFRRTVSPVGNVSWLVYLDGTSFLKEVEDKAEGTPIADVLRGAMADPGLALGVRSTEHGLQAEVAIRPATGVAGSSTLIASLAQAREQARRARAMAAMRGILMSCVIHAADKKGEWPASLDELVTSGILGEPDQARGLLGNPYADGDSSARRTFYLYRAPADPSKVADPAALVVLSEPALRDGGAHFGFFDGHVEYLTGPTAQSLLTQMRGR